jgi:transcriptional regulator
MTVGDRPLIPGTVDLLVLQALVGEARHGFDVSRTVHARTGGEVEIRDASLYQALHRLEERGWVRSRWGRSENRRRARYYELTTEGERHLARESRAFADQARAVLRMLGSGGAAGG